MAELGKSANLKITVAGQELTPPPGWFDVEVFKIYYRENYSLNTMSKATKINRSTLGKSIRFIKNFLKNEKQK